jgi:hypothetical protein
MNKIKQSSLTKVTSTNHLKIFTTNKLIIIDKRKECIDALNFLL